MADSSLGEKLDTWLRNFLQPSVLIWFPMRTEEFGPTAACQGTIRTKSCCVIPNPVRHGDEAALRTSKTLPTQRAGIQYYNGFPRRWEMPRCSSIKPHWIRLQENYRHTSFYCTSQILCGFVCLCFGCTAWHAGSKFLTRDWTHAPCSGSVES